MLSEFKGCIGRFARPAAVIFLLATPVVVRAQDAEPVQTDQESEVMTLDQVVRLAVERNPTAVAAEGALSIARADRLQQAGAWLPSLNLNSFYANSSNQRFDQATGQLQSQSYTAQLQGGYEVFSGGRRYLSQRAANAEVAAADADYASARFATVLAATQTFYSAAASVDLVRVAGQRLDRARDQLTAAQTRLELGTVTQSDALRAEIEVGNAEAALLDAEADLRASTLDLGRIVGVPGPVQPAAAALPDHAPALPSLDWMIQRATSASPIVTAAEANLRSRRANRLAAYTPYLPTLRVSGGYDWTSFSFPPEQQSWSMRVTATLPVFNGFQREAAVQRASANERIAQARASDAAIAARAAVESAAAEINSAERRVAISDRTVILAREDLRVQEERYQIGVATILELQTSQVALADAEIAAVRARQTLGTTIARLEAILGQSLREDG